MRLLRLSALLVLLVVVGSGANAQLSHTTVPTVDELVQACTSWRFSEASRTERTRKGFGRATEAVCRAAAETYQPRMQRFSDDLNSIGVIASWFDICRTAAIQMAQRPLDIVWCSSRNALREGGTIPDEIWEALDASPIEGIKVDKSARDQRLTTTLERQLPNDWSQSQIEAHIQSLGFACTDNASSGAPASICSMDIGELVSSEQNPLFVYGLHIAVTIRMDQPKGRRSIEVKTSEAHM